MSSPPSTAFLASDSRSRGSYADKKNMEATLLNQFDQATRNLLRHAESEAPAVLSRRGRRVDAAAAAAATPVPAATVESATSTAVSVLDDPRLDPDFVPPDHGHAVNNPNPNHDHLSTDDEPSTDDELRDVLRRSLEMVGGLKRRDRKSTKLRDFVFAPKFSAFDRQRGDAGMFGGFYALFWSAVTVLGVKIAMNNWRDHGNPLGTNEIMRAMFGREVLVLLFADGVMCGLTGLSWVLQVAVKRGHVQWDRGGWIIQHAWQTLFISSVVGLGFLRRWPWSHSVYFVLHGLVMLMKQHSYAFTNGHLSNIYEKRRLLLSYLEQLRRIRPVGHPSMTSPTPDDLSTEHLAHTPSAKERRLSFSTGHALGPDGTDVDRIAHAIATGILLDADQIRLFARIITWEIDAYADELKGAAQSPDKSYPNNLTMSNHYEYITLPTLVYELEYPRSDHIDWSYMAEKVAAMIGTALVMIMVSQAYIYPVVMQTVAMKEAGLPLLERLQSFPSVIDRLLFPFILEYLLAWYLLWETVLNVFAEVTRFADRSFYDAWWNSASWEQFARDWNRPVHVFLLRHVYHNSISSMRVGKHTAAVITFLLSACVHELVMFCIFQKLRGYLLVFQMSQLPLIRMSRTRFFRDRKTLGNVLFWFGTITAPSLCCSLYLML